MKNEKWKMKNEKWKMKNEKWKMKNEKWKMKNEKWKIKTDLDVVADGRESKGAGPHWHHFCQAKAQLCSIIVLSVSKNDKKSKKAHLWQSAGVPVVAAIESSWVRIAEVFLLMD